MVYEKIKAFSDGERKIFMAFNAKKGLKRKT